MAVCSVLRAASGYKMLLPSLTRNILGTFGKPSNTLVPCVRQMSGHKRTMQILPSRIEYNRWKDQVHFYLALGLIPLGLVITYSNVFIGSAELVDLPEDREPEHWEYFKHPISRWISKYVHDKPAKIYEIMLHNVSEEKKKQEWRRLYAKVETLMAERGDYKAWYYMPYNERRIYETRTYLDDIKTTEGSGT